MTINDNVYTHWAVNSRDQTLDVLTQVFATASNPPADANLDIVLLDKCHNLSWKVLSKLAKSRFIYRENMKPFMTPAINQLSNLFGMT